jgi:hypothetical protein
VDVSLTLVLVHDQVHIDAAGAEVAHHVKQLFVAERDDVDHYWAYYQATSQPFIESVHNCTVAGRRGTAGPGRHGRQDGALADPLPRGESILVEHRAGQREQAISDRTIERAFLHPVRSAHTEVRFDPARLPLAAERFTVVDGVEKVGPHRHRGAAAWHALVLDFGPRPLRGEMGVVSR